MRPLFALLLAGVILGSLALFFRLQEGSHVAAAPRKPELAAGRFDLEITLTFDAGPDPFALSAGDAPAIVVESLGDEILRRTDVVAAGSSVVVESVPGITVGQNSIYVRCTPKHSDPNLSRAVRVRILREGVEVADQSLWSAPGAAVEGLVELTVESGADGADGHTHPVVGPEGDVDSPRAAKSSEGDA